ncbi:hypothetical protein [Shewanella sp. UCD-KL12]|uniref:hypothetical protein n=1 Tax=Shewanella sp. UCD-KL12 TaxID=1917163 RepID=UPI000970BC55|nr:hypothetical protein [Shewanella sp. UCD-KL12]
MKYIFKNELITWLKEKELSRSEFIFLLQSSNYEEFKGLDSITVSRWTTGKTVPPLHKQLLIAQYMGVDIVDIICRVESSTLKVSEKISKTFKNLITILDFSSLTLSYKQQPKQSICKIRHQNFEEYNKYFSDFHKNICSLSDYFDELHKLGNSVDYTSITLENSKGEILSHYSGIEDLSQLEGLSLFEFIDKSDLSTSSLINVGYFNNSKHYMELLDYSICYYIISKINKKNLYLFVAGYPLFDITRSLLGIEETMYFPPKNPDSKLGVYLFKIDIMKALCNSILFPSAQKQLHCLQSCSNKLCNRCNLSDHIKTD